MKITILGGPNRGQVITLSQSYADVGRDERAHIRLSDSTVSPLHLSLVVEDLGVRFKDNQSKSGTRIGGVRVDGGVAPSGCEFSLGATTLRVDVESAPAASAESPLPAPGPTSFGSLIGASSIMQKLFGRLEQLAPTECPILLTGPTGTGKGLAARAIHYHSPRRRKHLVVLDCATLDQNLMNSRLLGQERGAFGALEHHPGVFEQASGGTLFLDEIGELPLELQPRLLRVLEQQEVTPVGGHLPLSVDVRIVAATGRDMKAMVNQGRFREDLYHRLAGETVEMPALEEHPEDIELLIQHILDNIPLARHAARQIQPEACAILAARTYRGNVRELRKVIENLAMLAAGPMITIDQLAAERLLASYQQRASDGELDPDEGAAPASTRPEPFKDAKQALLEKFERTYVRDLLEYTSNNLTQAARLASLDRQSLRELLKKYGFRTS